jgi:hypothetical protein
MTTTQTPVEMGYGEVPISTGQAAARTGFIDDPVLVERIWDGSARLVAERLGVSSRTVERWRGGHSVPRPQDVGSRDYRQQALKGWANRRARGSA